MGYRDQDISGLLEIEHEYAPLERIQDNHPKYVLTLDEDQRVRRKGIIHQYIREFLLSV
jgi:hypothetical protein